MIHISSGRSIYRGPNKWYGMEVVFSFLDCKELEYLETLMEGEYLEILMEVEHLEMLVKTGHLE
jgi:hypothetical protein